MGRLARGHSAGTFSVCASAWLGRAEAHRGARARGPSLLSDASLLKIMEALAGRPLGWLVARAEFELAQSGGEKEFG